MTEHNMRHLDFIRTVVEEDIAYVDRKDRQYGGSWKKRGGVGAFMMLARKWDRLENMLAPCSYDIFSVMGTECNRGDIGSDGTVLAEVRDLRRYLMLVEAEMMARGVIPASPSGVGAHVHVTTKTPVFAHPFGDNGGSLSQPLLTEHNPSIVLTPKNDPVVRHLDQYAEPIISEGKIYERGRAPRWLVRDKDNRALDVGDPCTCVLNGGDGQAEEVVVMKLTSMGIADVSSFSSTYAALGNELRYDPTRSRVAVTNTPRAGESEAATRQRNERRVPRFDGPKVPGPMKQALEEHESMLPENAAAPWIVTPGYWMRKNIEKDLFDKFWSRRAADVYVLEPHVQSENIPRILVFRNFARGEYWTLRVDKCSPGARDMFPCLSRECNMHEWEALPGWQRVMYAWNENSVKYELNDQSAAWHAEEAA